jgi:hypothetical protein
MAGKQVFLMDRLLWLWVGRNEREPQKPCASDPKPLAPTIILNRSTDAALEKLQVEHGSEKAFDLLHSRKSDPFGSGLSRYRYQKLKYEKLISFLPKRRYSNVLDVGCGLGTFTRELSPHAGRVLGMDLSEAA